MTTKSGEQDLDKADTKESYPVLDSHVTKLEMPKNIKGKRMQVFLPDTDEPKKEEIERELEIKG